MRGVVERFTYPAETPFIPLTAAAVLSLMFNFGKGVLKYLVRLGKRCQPSILEDALLERAAPNVIGARIH
ncbi:MAG TPA: hypothetical protein VL241_09470 [Gemmatimonadales bacterium]|nr:hypothetical protein [Gemmatimonadales bacterium]